MVPILNHSLLKNINKKIIHVIIDIIIAIELDIFKLLYLILIIDLLDSNLIGKIFKYKFVFFNETLIVSKIGFILYSGL